MCAKFACCFSWMPDISFEYRDRSHSSKLVMTMHNNVQHLREASEMLLEGEWSNTNASVSSTHLLPELLSSCLFVSLLPFPHSSVLFFLAIFLLVIFDSCSFPISHPIVHHPFCIFNLKCHSYFYFSMFFISSLPLSNSFLWFQSNILC